jgi:Secretion system C-terminal sorting domain
MSRFLLLLIFLAAVHPTFANTQPQSTSTALNCNLPAPVNVWITDATATSIAAAWTPVAGASSYLVKATNTNNGIAEYTGTTTGLAQNCTGLSSGADFVISVQAIDANGCISENAGIAKGSTDFIIVDDLIVQITPNSALQCNDEIFPTNDEGKEIALKYVRNGSESYEMFKISFGPNNAGEASILKVHHNNEDNYSGWQFGNGLSLPPTSGAAIEAQRVYVYKPGSPLSIGATLPPHELVIQIQNVTNTTQFGCKLCIISQPADNPYSLWHCEGDCSSTERSNSKQSAQTGRTLISPNPFEDQVQVHFSPVTEAPGQLRLMDANGREIYCKALLIGDTDANIYTQELPYGLYLIRLETADRVETHKVVKAE